MDCPIREWIIVQFVNAQHRAQLALEAYNAAYTAVLMWRDNYLRMVEELNQHCHEYDIPLTMCPICQNMIGIIRVVSIIYGNEIAEYAQASSDLSYWNEQEDYFGNMLDQHIATCVICSNPSLPGS